ncbi:hypothetical protein PR048_011586 [Dryococelus australis]|uniref:Uncharacterized protein n=1 Tax=Dryococelus australis TaxID=614101 RepID=A0ABQ9HLY3_9NEOP|nr:hypothetical protein PR048_011586 [Dryococelus australis]
MSDFYSVRLAHLSFPFSIRGTEFSCTRIVLPSSIDFHKRERLVMSRTRKQQDGQGTQARPGFESSRVGTVKFARGKGKRSGLRRLSAVFLGVVPPTATNLAAEMSELEFPRAKTTCLQTRRPGFESSRVGTVKFARGKGKRSGLRRLSAVFLGVVPPTATNLAAEMSELEFPRAETRATPPRNERGSPWRNAKVFLANVIYIRHLGPRRCSGQTTRLPPRRTGFDSRRGNRARRCCWSAGFLGDLPFPTPLHSGAAPYITSPSSALKTLLLKSRHISPLHCRTFVALPTIRLFASYEGELSSTPDRDIPGHSLAFRPSSFTLIGSQDLAVELVPCMASMCILQLPNTTWHACNQCVDVIVWTKVPHHGQLVRDLEVCLEFVDDYKLLFSSCPRRFQCPAASALVCGRCNFGCERTGWPQVCYPLERRLAVVLSGGLPLAAPATAPRWSSLTALPPSPPPPFLVERGGGAQERQINSIFRLARRLLQALPPFSALLKVSAHSATAGSKEPCQHSSGEISGNQTRETNPDLPECESSDATWIMNAIGCMRSVNVRCHSLKSCDDVLFVGKAFTTQRPLHLGNKIVVAGNIGINRERVATSLIPNAVNAV